MTRAPAGPADPTAAYYDRVAPTYDDLLRATPGDRWIRDAFCTWVAETAPPAGVVFDVGCGTGTDALWYAGRGLTVYAYDPAPGMMAQMQAKCREPIREGRIIPAPDGFSTESQPRVDIVTANFAVLNHLASPDGFFADAARVLAPGGSVMVSVHNPWFWKDIVRRRAWRASWWFEIFAVPWRGAVRLTLPYGTLHQHLTGRLRRAARPAFDLTEQAGIAWLIRHGHGDPDWRHPSGFAQRVERRWWRAPVLRSLGRYRFLRFQLRHA